jgi:hypothetical protein
VRYLRVGGTRQRRFGGTNFKSRNLPENAATPIRRVHAVLGMGLEGSTLWQRSAYCHRTKLSLSFQAIVTDHEPITILTSQLGWKKDPKVFEHNRIRYVRLSTEVRQVTHSLQTANSFPLGSVK